MTRKNEESSSGYYSDGRLRNNELIDLAELLGIC